MALHITNPTVELEVRNLVRQRGESITEVIGTAVRHLRCNGPETKKVKMSAEEILALVRSFPAGRIDYTLSKDQILGYGPNVYGES